MEAKLTIIGNLNISGTKIRELPSDLIVYGEVIAEGTEISRYDNEKMRHSNMNFSKAPSWRYGKYFYIPDDGVYVLIDKEDSRKLVRKIGHRNTQWMKLF